MTDLSAATQQYWIRHIDSWQSSGLSQADYCRQHSLSPRRFHYWKDKLTSSGVIPKITPQRRTRKAPPVSPSSFVPIAVNATPTPSGELTLSLPNGIELRGITQDTLSIVEQLMETLR